MLPVVLEHLVSKVLLVTDLRVFAMKHILVTQDGIMVLSVLYEHV
jgi:hypothetical protein